MQFELNFTKEALKDLNILRQSKHLQKQCKAVLKCLGLMQTNLKHPSLNTHKYTSLKGANNEDVFESYAENNTPRAYRIFWHYGSYKQHITIIAIIQHP